MNESDFLSFKRELWEIISAEGIVVTNQNLDWLLECAKVRLESHVVLKKENLNG